MTHHGRSINWHKMDIASDFLEIFHAILKGDINSRAKLDNAFHQLEWKETELVKKELDLEEKQEEIKLS